MVTLSLTCECGKQHTIYEGAIVSIPFGKLPEAVASATAHKCRKQKS